MGLAAKVAAEPKRQEQRQVHERILNELGKNGRLELMSAPHHALCT